MLKAAIIDDEMGAVTALDLLIKKHIKGVKVIANATQAEDGISLIDEHKPDIVFLDISMPDMNGFTLLKHLKHKKFHLIFTTAHERYALQAIKLHATDYLVKPVDVDELKVAIENVQQHHELPPMNKDMGFLNSRKLTFTGRISLPVKEGVIFMPVSDIIWIESHGNYCTIHTLDSKKHLVSKNIGEYEELLPEKEFFRAHKSHLINIRKVKKYIRTDGYYVEMEDGSVIEIARRKKDEFLQVMNELI